MDNAQSRVAATSPAQLDFNQTNSGAGTACIEYRVYRLYSAVQYLVNFFFLSLHVFATLSFTQLLYFLVTMVFGKRKLQEQEVSLNNENHESSEDEAFPFLQYTENSTPLPAIRNERTEATMKLFTRVVPLGKIREGRKLGRASIARIPTRAHTLEYIITSLELQQERKVAFNDVQLYS